MADNDRDDPFGDAYGAGRSGDPDRWPMNDEGPAGNVAGPRTGKSPVIKILLIILALCVLGAILCCGGVFWYVTKNVSTVTAPAEVNALTQEMISIDVPEEYLGRVIEELGPRRGEMIEMKNPGQGLVRLLYRIPARGLFGYRSEFLTDTRGTGIMHHRFLDYGVWAGPLAGRTRGSLVSMEAGTIVAFALFNLQDRSTLFVQPGDTVYEGMVVGESARPGDMDVNPTKEKKLTNMRSKGSDENIQLEPPRELTLEAALEYIEDDELIEVTPQTIRLRKRFLSTSDRKRLSREAKRERASV